MPFRYMEWKHSSTYHQPWRWIEVNDQLHASITLPPGNEPLVALIQEVGWAPELA
jgi:hypothetical protein